jgi:hypothetical protein
MKLAVRLLTTLLLCSFLAKTQAQCPLGLSGTFKIGPSGNYPTLTAALAVLHTKGLSGPITLELQTAYTCTAETFPVTFNATPCASPANNITIRPEAGAGALTITSNDSIATFDLNNGSFYTLEGRPGGTDTAHQLLIANTHLSGTAIRFINGASYNELNHLVAQGVNNITNGGVITLAGTDSVANNTYNRIDSCTVTAGATQPVYGILATDYHPNKHNVINGCNISNVGGTWLYGAYGIYVPTGYDSITVTNNSVYQTTAYNVPYNQYVQPWAYTGLLVGGPYDGGDLIENNYVGGSQPKAGGTPMLLNNCNLFTGISASSYTGAALASQVIGNTITNVSFGGPNGAACVMIDLGQFNRGGFNGACANNTIGNRGAGYSIQCPYTSQSASGNNVNLTGIMLEPSDYTDPVRITGNRIGGWQTDARLGYGTFFAINARDDLSPYNVLTIDSNQIGDDSSANSILIQNTGNALGITASDPNCECTPAHDSIIITNNHIANFSGPSIQGIEYYIWTSALVDQAAQGRIVSDNTLTNLNGSSITGIDLINNNLAANPNGTGNVLCTGNTLTGLGNLSNGSGVAITGISFSSTGFANTMHCSISGNRLTSFFGATVTGIAAGGEYLGVSTLDNNMIDLGLLPDGRPFDLAYDPSFGFAGIHIGHGFTCLHNSVYIHVPGYGPTAYGIYAACIADDDTSSTTGIVMNNILSAYVPSLDKNFALMKTSPSVRSDYNIFNVQGHGYVGWQVNPSGYFTDSTLAQWQSATGGDQHSQFADPLFDNPEASSAYIDLHLQQGTPAESTGTPAYTTLTDIDGKLRAQYTPVDIGADAGNFKYVTPPPPDTTKKDTTATPTPPTPTDSTIVVPYPNPFSSSLTLNLIADAPGTAHVLVYSLTGKLVASLHPAVIAGSNTLTIPTDAFPDGVYILHVFIGNKRQTLEIQKKTQ